MLKQLIEAGDVTPVIDHTYALSETSEAISHVAGAGSRGGHARGKVTITLIPPAVPASASSLAAAA